MYILLVFYWTMRIALALSLLLFYVYGHPEDMEYDDYDSPEVPSDWKDHIDEETLNERLSERSIGHLLHGDILYGSDQMTYEAVASPIALVTGDQRAVATGRPDPRMWPVRNHSIPYEIHEDFYAQDKFLIQSVLKSIEDQTQRCITFSEQHVPNGTSGIVFQLANGCYSEVGMQSRSQPIGLSRSNCMEFGIILHEVMHALGFYHEHSRADRDQYVRVHYHNLKSNVSIADFEIMRNMKTYGIPYDLESIMHYGACDFANIRDPCTEPVLTLKAGKPGRKYEMGQRKQLSTGDLSKLLAAYSCSNSEKNAPETIPEGTSAFPGFSSAPMSFEQCRSQFNENCKRFSATVDNCTVYTGLAIKCNYLVTHQQLSNMVQIMSKPPLRPIQVFLRDRLISPSIFSPVKVQVVVLDISHCAFRRTTAKLLELRFTNLIHLELTHCTDLAVRKSDFQFSQKLHIIIFYLSTIESVEKGTFMDLEHLALLALDGGISRLRVLDDKTQKNVERIHCGCSFSWLRSWWQSNQKLKKEADWGEIHRSPLYNPAYAKEEIFLPVNCSALPLAYDSINFLQDNFSINEPECLMNESNATTMDDFHEFSLEPMGPEQCALQFTENCSGGRGLTVGNCTTNKLLAIDCNAGASAVQLQELAFAISQPPIRAVKVSVHDGENLDYFIYRQVRRQVVVFWIWLCISSRTTQKLYTLDFGNLLEFSVCMCDDLIVHKKDFSTSTRLKIITFFRTTIRYLEKNAFDNLSQLRFLSLEEGLSTLPTLTRHMRGYLNRLHCDCQYAWLRSWIAENRALLSSCEDGEVYKIENAMESEASTKEQVRLDCAVPLPADPRSLNYSQTEFSVNAPQCMDDNKTEMVSNIFVQHAEFSEDPMTLAQCRLQFTDNCASSMTTVQDCDRFRLLDIRCNSAASSDEIDTMVQAMSSPPVRPIRLFFRDSRIRPRWTSWAETTFAPIQLQVISVMLVECASNRTTGSLVKLGLFALLKVEFCNCRDILVEKADFAKLTEMRLILFYNTTIYAMERGTFVDLPELRLLSLENGLAPLVSHDRQVWKYVFKLHCSCEYAWWRRWWQGNALLMFEAQAGEIFFLFEAVKNGAYSKDEIYLPVDCGRTESTPDTLTVNLTQEEFSINEVMCG